MGAQVRIVVNRQEVGRLLRGEGIYLGVRRDMEERGHRVAATAGPGHTAAEFIGHDRVRVHVYADSIDAKLNEQRTRNLTRALDAAR